MTFSKDEKHRAHSSINIENFQGILGDISGGSVSLHNQMQIAKGDFASLRRCLADGGLAPEDIDELEQAIQDDPPPVAPGSFGKKVSEWTGRMMAKAASGAWQIGINAAGRFLGTALGSNYGL